METFIYVDEADEEDISNYEDLPHCFIFFAK